MQGSKRKPGPWKVFFRAMVSAVLVLAAEHHLLTDQLVWHLGQYVGRTARPTPDTPVEVVVVQLDNKVIANTRRNPYPRKVLLDVLKALEKTPVAAVGLDIFLDEGTIEIDPTVSKALAAQMAKMGNVVAAVRHVNGHLVEFSPFYKSSVAATGAADIMFVEGQPVRAVQTDFEGEPSFPAAMIEVWHKQSGIENHQKWPEEVPLNMSLPMDSIVTHIEASTLIAGGKLPIASQPGKPVFVVVSPYDDYASDIFMMCRDGATYDQVHGGDIHAFALATLVQPRTPIEVPEAPHGYIMWLGGVVLSFLFCRGLHHRLGARVARWVTFGLLAYTATVVVFASFGSLLPIGLPAAGLLLGLHLAESAAKDDEHPATGHDEGRRPENQPQKQPGA